MKCSACGHENIYGSTTCKQCGASLTAVAQPAPAAPAAASGAKAAAPAKKAEPAKKK